MLEQLSRPVEKRCPIAKASNEVVELLLDHWHAFSGACVSNSLDYRTLLTLQFSSYRLYNHDLPTLFLGLPESAHIGDQFLCENVGGQWGGDQ